MSDYRSRDLSQPQRQSLWAVAFLAFRTLRSIGVVQLLLFAGFVVARLPSVLAAVGLAGVVGVALFAAAAVRWWRYTFQIAGDELVVQRGVFQQQRLSIPLGRVQSVSLEQKLLHRLVSLVQISLDTAGTEAAEFVIDAVDRDVARTLQQAVANHRGTAGSDASATEAQGPSPAPSPPEQVLLAHSPGRVVQIALSQAPFAGLVLIGPLVALGDEIGRLLPFELPEFQEPTSLVYLLWLVPLVLGVGLAVSIALNLARVLLTEWDLTLRFSDTGLRRDAGLISTTSIASPVQRIQIVESRQNPLERWWSLRRVQLVTIGDVNLALPGCTQSQSEMIRDLALAGSLGVERVDQRVSSAEVLLKTRTSAILASLSATALFFVIGWWSLLALVVVPWTAATSFRRVRLRRWGVAHDAIAVRNEFVGWQRQEALLRKLTSVTVSQRRFERSRGLATVRIETAAGAVSIGMIAADEATRLRDAVLYAVETDREPWM